MAENPWYIKTYDTPTIELDEISIPDYEYGTRQDKLKDRRVRQSLMKGEESPVVKMGGTIFSNKLIKNFSLNLSGRDAFLPECRVSFVDDDAKFIDQNYPMDGDLMGIYLKSSVKELKPVRNDYQIESVNSGDLAGDGRGGLVSVRGVLRVPRLYGEESRAYKDKTSWEVLREIATDLQLGFASNVSETDDEMTWINPNTSRYEFIQHVCSHAYKDDESFFICFIDQYYILNFINVNQQFNNEEKFDPAKITRLFDASYTDESAEVDDFNQTDELFLTNDNSRSGNNSQIYGYTLIQNTGSIARTHGYQRHVQFYDFNQREYVDLKIQPLNTQGAEDKFLQRGRIDENFWKDEIKYKWLGIQHNKPAGNVHANYLYAKIQNTQNNIEIGKMGLKMSLPMFNPNIIRYMRLPILIVVKNDEYQQTSVLTPEDENQKKDRLPNQFLSGFYVVMDIRYTYSSDDRGIKQEIYAVKREWDRNFGTTSHPEFRKRLADSENGDNTTAANEVSS